MSVTIDDIGGDAAAAALAAAAQWAQPQILGYHHPCYQAVLTAIMGDDLRCLRATHATQGMCGVLPYRVGKTRHGDVINALPFFGSNGMAAALDQDTEARLLTAFKTTVRRAGVFSAALYTPFMKNCAAWPADLEPDTVVVKFTQYLDLTTLGAWPPKRAADLRRAAQRGLNVRPATPADGAKILELYGENCRSAGIPMKPAAFVTETLAQVADLGDAAPMQWLAATHNDDLVAALLYGRGPVTASYILPCAAAAERTHQPNALLMDFAIRREAARGLRYWNFESSPAWDDPVFKFKARWGAQTAPFAVVVFYGQRRQKPSAEEIAAARADLRYYFIAPAGQVSGTWPADVALPDGFEALTPYLARG